MYIAGGIAPKVAVNGCFELRLFGFPDDVGAAEEQPVHAGAAGKGSDQSTLTAFQLEWSLSGRLQPVLEQIPVFVVTQKNVGLLCSLIGTLSHCTLCC